MFCIYIYRLRCSGLRCSRNSGKKYDLVRRRSKAYVRVCVASESAYQARASYSLAPTKACSRQSNPASYTDNMRIGTLPISLIFIVARSPFILGIIMSSIASCTLLVVRSDSASSPLYASSTLKPSSARIFLIIYTISTASSATKILILSMFFLHCKIHFHYRKRIQVPYKHINNYMIYAWFYNA